MHAIIAIYFCEICDHAIFIPPHFFLIKCCCGGGGHACMPGPLKSWNVADKPGRRLVPANKLKVGPSLYERKSTNVLRYFFITAWSTAVLIPESMCIPCADHIFKQLRSPAFKRRAGRKNPSTGLRVCFGQSCLTKWLLLLSALVISYVYDSCWCPLFWGSLLHSFRPISELPRRILLIFW